MTEFKRFLFRSLVAPLKLGARLFADHRIFGAHHIPPGPKIYAHNHISSLDTLWVLPVFPEPVHTVVGPAYHSRLAALALDYFEQINAMPDHRATVVDRAVAHLRHGEPVHIAPEGDLQVDGTLGRFYPGTAKIYRKHPVPIVPIAIVARDSVKRRVRCLDMTIEGRLYQGLFVFRGPYFVSVGQPFTPKLNEMADEKQDNKRIMQELKTRIQTLINDVRSSHSEATD